MGGELLIKAKDIKKVYPPDIVALDGLDFEMKKNDFVSLIGPTGCGKTTFLKIIAGFEPIQRGEIYFNGVSIKGKGPNWRRGMIFQDIRLFPWFTIRENLLFGLKEKKVPKDKWGKILKELTNLMGLEEVLDEYPAALGLGMQQRAGFARVLMNDPDILLCDEPLSSLDWVTREYLQTEILKLWYNTKKAVLFVTHNVAEAVYVGQRVVVLTARPGRRKTTVDIDLPKRRWEVRRNDKKYLKLVEHTGKLVEDELAKAREMEKKVGY